MNRRALNALKSNMGKTSNDTRKRTKKSKDSGDVTKKRVVTTTVSKPKASAKYGFAGAMPKVLNIRDKLYMDLQLQPPTTSKPVVLGKLVDGRFGSNPGAILLNGVGQGSGSRQREGIFYTNKSLYINGYIRPLQNSSIAENSEITLPGDPVTRAYHGPYYLRMLVVYVTNVNGTPPPLADILSDIGAPADDTANVSAFSGTSMVEMMNVKVLMDHRIVTPQITIQPNSVQVANNTDWPPQENGPLVQRYLKLPKGLFTGVTAQGESATAYTVSTINQGGIFMYLIQDNKNENGDNTLAWSFVGTSRLRFEDTKG